MNTKYIAFATVKVDSILYTKMLTKDNTIQDVLEWASKFKYGNQISLELIDWEKQGILKDFYCTKRPLIEV